MLIMFVIHIQTVTMAVMKVHLCVVSICDQITSICMDKSVWRFITTGPDNHLIKHFAWTIQVLNQSRSTIFETVK